MSYRQMRETFDLSFDIKEMLSYWLKGNDRSVGGRNNIAHIITMLILIIVNLPAWLSPRLRSPVGIVVNLYMLVWVRTPDRYKNDRDHEEEWAGTVIFFAFIIFPIVLFDYVKTENSGSLHSGSSYHDYSTRHK